MASYTVKQMANILGVHPDTLRNWDRDGLLVPHRINKRGDRRYTEDHIRQARETLIPNPQIQALKRSEEYGKYSRDQLIDELETLKGAKRFGLVWDDSEEEEVVKRCKKDAPILIRQKKKRVSAGENKLNHVFIEGDNYHAMQMLNYTHHGQIDVIYIDPPYNTGATDWKYNNKYVDENDRFRHSKWLNMMKQRLRLARDLLSEDGFIACAIDHYELFYLGALMDDLFFEENRLGIVTIVHKPEGRQFANFFSASNEFLLVYAKNKSAAKFQNIVLNEKKAAEFDLSDDAGNYKLKSFIRLTDGKYSLRENKPKGFYPIYVSSDLKNFSLTERVGYVAVYPTTDKGVERVWNASGDTFMDKVREGNIAAIKEGGRINIYELKRASEVFVTHWIKREYHGYHHGTKLLESILGEIKSFDFPKSLYSVLDFMKITAGKNATVLDFFAGSGTTGHAVMELNKQDGGNRKFILCTNNENHNGNGSGGIAEAVCYPRIKKVMEGYKENGNGEKIPGLGGNLEYFTTGFVDVENIEEILDFKKLEFTHEAGQLIALKEHCFNETERNKYYQIFTNDEGKYVGLYFREDHSKLMELEKKLLDKPDVRMYIFTYDGGGFHWAERYADYGNVRVEDIPTPILKVYERINL